jgi:hypothetical protein
MPSGIHGIPGYRVKLFVWLTGFIFFSVNQINEMNPINQINQTNRMT